MALAGLNLEGNAIGEVFGYFAGSLERIHEVHECRAGFRVVPILRACLDPPPQRVKLQGWEGLPERGADLFLSCHDFVLLRLAGNLGDKAGGLQQGSGLAIKP